MSQDKQRNNKKPQNTGRRPSHVQTQIESQLSQLFNRTQVLSGNLPPIASLKEEGVDHINVNRRSRYNLGKLLSTGAELTFKLYGQTYASIDNLILFYRSHCSQPTIPMADQTANTRFFRTHIDKYPKFSNVFTLVCLAYIEIFKNNRALFEALLQNDLPLDSYVVKDNRKTRHATSQPLLLAIQEAFECVRDKREPRLQLFMFERDAQVLHREAALSGESFMKVHSYVYSHEAVLDRFKQIYPELHAELDTSILASYDDGKVEEAAEAVDDDEASGLDLGEVAVSDEPLGEAAEELPVDETSINPPAAE